MVELRGDRAPKTQAASDATSDVCVTFTGLLPDEKLIGLLRRHAALRGHRQVSARIRRAPGGAYEVRVHHGPHSDAYQHARASLALQGAYSRLDMQLSRQIQEPPC